MSKGERINASATDVVVSASYRSLLPAQILSIAASCLGSIVNGFLVGNYLSQTALAALGFVIPLNTMLGAISTIVSAGARMFTGESLGRGDREEQQRIFSSSMRILTAVGIALTVLSFLFSGIVADIVGAAGNLREPTSVYIKGMSLGIIPALLVPCLMVFLQLSNDSNFSLVAAFLLAGFSLVSGLINLYCFDGGILGMGIAESIAKWLTLGAIVLRAVRKKQMRMTRDRMGRKRALRMLYVGFPTALAAILYALRNSILNVIARKYCGDMTVASMALLNSMMGPMDSVNVGVGTVCLTLCSLYLGMKDKEGMKAVIRTTMRIGLIAGFAKVAFLVAFADPLAHLFGATGQLHESTAELIRCYSLSMPLNMITMCFVSPEQCLGRIKKVSLFYLLNAMLAPLAFVLLTVGVIGEYSIYYCYAVAEVISIAFFYIVSFMRGARSVRIEENVELPENEGRFMNISVRTPDEVSEVSEKAIAFCQDNGIEYRRSYFCGLCLEEMTGNTVSHGFRHSKKKKKLSADIYIHVYDGKITLRVCDNCVSFNPLERAERDGEGDITKNIGIRMVQRLADEVSYQSTFGQNIVDIEWNSPEAANN